MRFICLLLCSLLISCAQIQPISDKLIVISVDEIDTNQNKTEFCSDFKLNKEQAQAYFDQASIITAVIMHNEFEYLPCFVRGKGQLDNKICQWEIRAGGIAHFDFKEKSYIYGCKSCPEF